MTKFRTFEVVTKTELYGLGTDIVTATTPAKALAAVREKAWQAGWTRHDGPIERVSVRVLN